MKRWNAAVFTAAVAFWGAVSLRAADSDEAGTLYQRLGGMPAIHAVVDDLVTRILADSRVNKWFAHAASDPEATKLYRDKLADFVCQATGGRCVYTGRDMMAAHQGRGVTSEAFNAVVDDLVATLDKLKVPEKEKSQLLGLLAPLKAAIVQPEHVGSAE